MRLVLLVPHKGTPKMAGKLFELPGADNDKHVFLHETSSRQHHIKTDSPGGLDEVVLDWLRGLPFGVVIDFKIKEENTTYRAFPLAFLHYGIQEISDGRNRFYLPVKFWGVLPQGTYAIPWITNRKILEEPAWQSPPVATTENSSRSSRRTSPGKGRKTSAPDSDAKQPRLDLPLK